MNCYSRALIVSIGLLMAYCSSVDRQKSPFILAENDQGIELSENGKPVFFYQKKQKSLTDKYLCNNYIHPLYNLNGDILTEEFPPDHPYHRGIFWAWHQLYVDNKRVGDGWVNDSISQSVVKISTDKNNNEALIKLNVLWSSLVLQDGKPFIDENTTITVHKTESDLRKIDFEITLKALVNGLEIGGSADEKGYGGFCVRMKLPEGLIFTSEQGAVTPRELQVRAGSWMDFSAGFGNDQKISGLAILCHPSMPDYPEPWILRQKSSMQNVVYPGRERIKINADKPVVLRYRVIIHNGDAKTLDLPALQKEYSEMYRK
jgi:hypothetical protein